MLDRITRITRDNRMKGLTSSTSYTKKRFKNLRITSSKTRSHRRFKRPLEKIPQSLLKKKEEIQIEKEKSIHENDDDEAEGSKNDPNSIINDVERNANHVLVDKDRKMEDFKKLVNDKVDDDDHYSEGDYDDDGDY